MLSQCPLRLSTAARKLEETAKIGTATITLEPVMGRKQNIYRDTCLSVMAARFLNARS